MPAGPLYRQTSCEPGYQTCQTAEIHPRRQGGFLDTFPRLPPHFIMRLILIILPSVNWLMQQSASSLLRFPPHPALSSYSSSIPPPFPPSRSFPASFSASSPPSSLIPSSLLALFDCHFIYCFCDLKRSSHVSIKCKASFRLTSEILGNGKMRTKKSRLQSSPVIKRWRYRQVGERKQKTLWQYTTALASYTFHNSLKM